jgi:hypothetical protein
MIRSSGESGEPVPTDYPIGGRVYLFLPLSLPPIFQVAGDQVDNIPPVQAGSRYGRLLVSLARDHPLWGAGISVHRYRCVVHTSRSTERRS